MISHSDRAREWHKDNWARFWPLGTQGYYLDPCRVCDSLAAKFEAILPEGAVAVDRELLREVLTAKEYPPYRLGEERETCSWEGCGYLNQSWGDNPNLPHGDGCPLGETK